MLLLLKKEGSSEWQPQPKVRYFSIDTSSTAEKVEIVPSSDGEIFDFPFDESQEKFDGNTCLEDLVLESNSRDRLILLSNCGGDNIRIIEYDAREDTERSTV